MGAFHAGTGFGSFGVDGGSCDFLVCKFLRRGRAGKRGGNNEQRRQTATPQISKRSRAGDRQTAHLGRSAFRLTREGEVFEQAAPMLLG